MVKWEDIKEPKFDPNYLDKAYEIGMELGNDIEESGEAYYVVNNSETQKIWNYLELEFKRNKCDILERIDEEEKSYIIKPRKKEGNE